MNKQIPQGTQADTCEDQTIRECFGEIKQVLKVYGCEMYVRDSTTIIILAEDSLNFIAYDEVEFNK